MYTYQEVCFYIGSYFSDGNDDSLITTFWNNFINFSFKVLSMFLISSKSFVEIVKYCQKIRSSKLISRSYCRLWYNLISPEKLLNIFKYFIKNFDNILWQNSWRDLLILIDFLIISYIITSITEYIWFIPLKHTF